MVLRQLGRRCWSGQQPPQSAFVLHWLIAGVLMAKRKAAKKATGRKRTAAKRELINTGTDKRYVRRGARGRFTESDDVGRSLAADRRRKAKRTVKSGQGDRGDQAR
jgi:hypothetical protein